MRKFLKPFVLVTGLLICSLSFANTTANLLRNPNDPVSGNPKGDVTVVEFFDYQCSHCVSMAPVMDSTVRANPHVRVVYKQFPIRGPMSALAARAAIAANMQGKYKAFSNRLFNAPQPLTENTIYTVAKESGLDMTKFKKDLHDKKVDRIVRDTMNLAQQVKLTGTPAFFIAKTNAQNENEVNFVLGEMSQSDLQSAIDKAK